MLEINTYEVNIDLVTWGHKLKLFLRTMGTDVPLRFDLIVMCYLVIFFSNVNVRVMFPFKEKKVLEGTSNAYD